VIASKYFGNKKMMFLKGMHHLKRHEFLRFREPGELLPIFCSMLLLQSLLSEVLFMHFYVPDMYRLVYTPLWKYIKTRI